MKSKAFFLVSAGVILFTTVSASALGVPAPLQGIWQNLTDVPNRLITGISGPLNSRLDTAISDAINKAMGAMGLADPDTAGETARKAATQSGGALSEVYADIKDRQAQAAAAKTTAQAVLGQAGQQASKQELQQTTESAAGVEKSAQAAASVPVTQRKLDALLQQNAQIATIQSNIYSQNQKANQQLATANNSLAEINAAHTRQELKETREAQESAQAMLENSVMIGQ